MSEVMVQTGDLWVVEFDNERSASKGYYAFPWGDMRRASRADLVAAVSNIKGAAGIRWCNTHESKMPGGWGECHWAYQMLRDHPPECVEGSRLIIRSEEER